MEKTKEKKVATKYDSQLATIEQKLRDYILSNYDINTDKVSVKFIHTFRTRLVSDEIARSLSLNDRDMYLSSIIALFHDYARFEQAKRFDSFNDLTTIDHGDLAVEMLFDKGEIKNFVDDLTDEELEIARLAIKNHNKYAIEEGLSERQMLFCKLIRDADKVDIYRIIAKDPRLDGVKDGKVRKEDIENFYKCRQYLKGKDYDFYASVLIHISLIFDLNFKGAFVILDREQYIEKYRYTLLLTVTFKIDEEVLKCFEFAKKYVHDKANEVL